LAFIVEQAGGKASDGYKRILELKPESLHQREPLFIGSYDMVAKAEEFLQVYKDMEAGIVIP
jgi:fructose-1,6-bisphosphatase I